MTVILFSFTRVTNIVIPACIWKKNQLPTSIFELSGYEPAGDELLRPNNLQISFNKCKCFTSEVGKVPFNDTHKCRKGILRVLPTPVLHLKSQN